MHKTSKGIHIQHKPREPHHVKNNMISIEGEGEGVREYILTIEGVFASTNWGVLTIFRLALLRSTVRIGISKYSK